MIGTFWVNFIIWKPTILWWACTKLFLWNSCMIIISPLKLLTVRLLFTRNCGGKLKNLTLTTWIFFLPKILKLQSQKPLLRIKNSDVCCNANKCFSCSKTFSTLLHISLKYCPPILTLSKITRKWTKLRIFEIWLCHYT